MLEPDAISVEVAMLHYFLLFVPLSLHSLNNEKGRPLPRHGTFLEGKAAAFLLLAWNALAFSFPPKDSQILFFHAILKGSNLGDFLGIKGPWSHRTVKTSTKMCPLVIGSEVQVQVPDPLHPCHPYPCPKRWATGVCPCPPGMLGMCQSPECLLRIQPW